MPIESLEGIDKPKYGEGKKLEDMKRAAPLPRQKSTNVEIPATQASAPEVEEETYYEGDEYINENPPVHIQNLSIGIAAWISLLESHNATDEIEDFAQEMMESLKGMDDDNTGYVTIGDTDYGNTINEAETEGPDTDRLLGANEEFPGETAPTEEVAENSAEPTSPSNTI